MYFVIGGVNSYNVYIMKGEQSVMNVPMRRRRRNGDRLGLKEWGGGVIIKHAHYAASVVECQFEIL